MGVFRHGMAGPANRETPVTRAGVSLLRASTVAADTRRLCSAVLAVFWAAIYLLRNGTVSVIAGTLAREISPRTISARWRRCHFLASVTVWSASSASIPSSIRGSATPSGTTGLSRYGELFISVPVIGFRGHCPRAARAPGARNASQVRAGFFLLRVLYPPHSRPPIGAGLPRSACLCRPRCDIRRSETESLPTLSWSKRDSNRWFPRQTGRLSEQTSFWPIT